MPATTLRSRLESLVARGLMSLPAALLRRFAGPPVRHGDRQLDVQAQLLLRMQKATGKKPWYEVAVERARRDLDADSSVLAPNAGDIDVNELQVASALGPRGARCYRPRGIGTSAPALVFFHGGGFVLGSLDSHDGPCRRLAAIGRCVVISVDYRLAPEAPFPAAPDDALAAFRDLVTRAGELGLDPARIAVGGDSAGGNLAAVVSQDSRDHAMRPCFQLLIYPAVDLTRSFPSIQSLGRGFLLEKASMDWFMARYLAPGQDQKAPRGSPLYGEAKGVAPALVVIAGFDPLSDEGEAYAQKLREAGVAVEVQCHDGLIHGFINLAGGVRAAGEALDRMAQSLRLALHA